MQAHFHKHRKMKRHTWFFFLLNQGDCLFVSVDLENRDPPMIFTTSS